MDGDEIIRVGDVPVKDYPEFSALLAQQPDKAVQITVRRAAKKTTKRQRKRRRQGSGRQAGRIARADVRSSGAAASSVQFLDEDGADHFGASRLAGGQRPELRPAM